MELKQQNILMFARTMALGGTEGVVLQICRILKPQVNRIVVCSCGGVHEKTLAEMGIAHYTVADIEDKSPAVILSVLRDVGRILKKEQITAVHTHHRMAAFYTRLLRAFHPFVFVNTSHNTFSDKRTLTRFAFQKAHLIACGQQVKENLTGFYGLDPDRITVIHNAADPWDGPVTPDPQLTQLRSQGFALVGNVGRLSPQKGMEYFLRALPGVKQAGIPVKFILIGEGEERENLESLARELEIRDDILFLGYRSDIPNVMAQMDFLVLSSLWEGLPLTPMEAFSAEKTVIGTTVDGTPEIITHGHDGLLVPPRDPQSLADAIRQLLEDPVLRDALAQNALQTYRSRFSIDRYRREITEFYTNL